MDTMWAIRKTRSGPGLVFEEVPVPTPGRDEVLVHVEAAGVCGTDLHIFRWDDWSRNRIRPPLTLGHEFAGTVVEVGPDVRHAAVGDYVSAESHVTCGHCFACRTGRAHMCERTQIIGVDRDGAFAQYVAVPESVLWQNDRSTLPPEIAALQEPFGNAVFATSHADVAARSVAVLGCGPIGLFTIGIVRASGARRVLATETHPYRAGLARQMGAEVIDLPESVDAGDQLVAANDGEHLDVVFEMSGAPEAIDTAFRVARNGGRVVLFGIPSRPVTIDVAEALIFKNLDVAATSGREIFASWYTARWLLETGVVDLRPLVTERLPLSEFERAFSLLASGEACKVVLHPDGVADAPLAAVPEEADEADVVLPLARWAHR